MKIKGCIDGNLSDEFINSFDKLPFRESRKEFLTRKYGNMYNLNKFDQPWHKDLIYYKLADYILNNNIGKSFDMAFHYYCTKVPKYQQCLFLQNFRTYNRYYIDENGLIKKNNYKWNY